MEDPSYYLYTARQLRETAVVTTEVPPNLVKIIRETQPEVIARYIWENQHLLKEGTRAFFQPKDLIDRSTKPTTTKKTKNQSEYPHVPEEKPSSTHSFPDRAPGAENPEPLLHETRWPFKEGDYGIGSHGFTGMGSDSLGSNVVTTPETDDVMSILQGQGNGQGMSPMQQPPMELPQQDPSSMIPQPEPETPGHPCPICKTSFDGDDALIKHFSDEHMAQNTPVFGREPTPQMEGDLPSSQYPFER